MCVWGAGEECTTLYFYLIREKYLILCISSLWSLNLVLQVVFKLDLSDVVRKVFYSNVGPLSVSDITLLECVYYCNYWNILMILFYFILQNLWRDKMEDVNRCNLG